MAKCPQCHEEIDQLLEEETRTSKCRVQLADAEGKRLLYEEEQGIATEYTFDCPKCYATLQLCSEDNARAFLKGELDLDE